MFWILCVGQFRMCRLKTLETNKSLSCLLADAKGNIIPMEFLHTKVGTDHNSSMHESVCRFDPERRARNSGPLDPSPLTFGVFFDFSPTGRYKSLHVRTAPAPCKLELFLDFFFCGVRTQVTMRWLQWLNHQTN